MAVTRIKSPDIGDGQVLTADIGDAQVTFSKLQLATNPALEDSTGIRVKVASLGSLYRDSNGLGVNLDPDSIEDVGDGVAAKLESGGGLSAVASTGLRNRGFRTTGTLGTAGDTQYDSTSAQHRVYDGLASRSIVGLLAAQTTASQTVASTTTETFFNSNQQYTFPANFFTAGRKIRMVAWGRYGLDGGGATINLRWNLGSNNLIDTGGQLPLTSASLNRNWRMEVDLYCITDGSSGTFMFGGLASMPTTVVVPAATNSVTQNTTGTILTAVSVQFSASSSTNRANMLGLLIETN